MAATHGVILAVALHLPKVSNNCLQCPIEYLGVVEHGQLFVLKVHRQLHAGALGDFHTSSVDEDIAFSRPDDGSKFAPQDLLPGLNQLDPCPLFQRLDFVDELRSRRICRLLGR